MPPRVLVVGLLIGLFASACHGEQLGSNTAGSSSTKLIALTFDDGPTATVTSALLDILRANNAKATFFPMGTNIYAAPALVKRIAAEGHAVGNHTLSHRRLTDLPDETIQAEIQSTNVLLRDITGQTPVVFRPPYAALNDRVIEIARANGLAIVLWSVYPEMAGGLQDASSIADRVVATARDGDIVFLHDTSMRTVEATEAIIEELSEKGFEFVSVPEIIRHRLQFVAGDTYRAARDIDK